MLQMHRLVRALIAVLVLPTNRFHSNVLRLDQHELFQKHHPHHPHHHNHQIWVEVFPMHVQREMYITASARMVFQTLRIGVNQISLKAKKKPNLSAVSVATTTTTISAMPVVIM
jgi:hypothetical protein